MTDLNFDFSQINPIFEGGSFLPVSDAKGWLVILNRDGGWKPSKSGKGNYLEIGGVGQEGIVSGVEFTLRFNLQHTEPKAVAAATQELTALGYVTGMQGRIGNVAEMFNRPFRIISEQQKGPDGQPTQFTQLATNGLRDVNGNMAGKAGAGPQVAQPAPQAPAANPAPFGGAPAAPFGGQPQGGNAPAFGGPQGGQPAAFGAPQQAPAPFGAPQQPNPFGAPAGGGGAAPAWAAQPGR